MNRTYILKKPKKYLNVLNVFIKGTFLDGGIFIHFSVPEPEQNPQPVKNRHTQRISPMKA
jgi:hypothetical protein